MSQFYVDAVEEEIDDGSSTWPPPERKVITQSYDLSIQTLQEQWATERLEIPEFQRDYVWDNRRASRLIESFLLNIPIPVVYFAETESAIWEIIDGHQRIKSVIRYLRNEFALTGLMVLSNFSGKRFHELPDREQRYLLTRTLRAVVLAPESHPNMKFEIFERLNTGSAALNAQEIRNSLYRGSFNRMLRDLVKNRAFREAIGGKASRKRMVDEELILRFFALYSNYEGYRAPLKVFLNDFMRSVQHADASTLNRYQHVFQHTIDLVHDVFRTSAFRLTDPLGQPTERLVNRALFDAQMLAFSRVKVDEISHHRDAILVELSRTYEEEEFLDAIQRATGNRTRVIRRVEGVVEALGRAGVPMESAWQHE